MRLGAEEGGRACCANGAFEGVADGLSLAGLGGDADHFFGRAEGWDGQGEGVRGNGFDAREMAFLKLLHFAGEVEFDQFDEVFFLEAGHGRIVESQMAVFAHTEAAEVDRLLFEEGFVAGAFIEREIHVAFDEMKGFGFDKGFDPVTEVFAKTGFVVLINAEVFVHVEEGHLGPIDAFEIDEFAEKLDLGITSGENDGGGTLALDHAGKVSIYFARGETGQLFLTWKNMNIQLVRFETPDFCFVGNIYTHLKEV